MPKHLDTHSVQLTKGSVIDLRQTVNGQNVFVVLNDEPLDIRYSHDLSRKYEYDKEDLLAPSKLTGEVDWRIIGNVSEWCKELCI